MVELEAYTSSLISLQTVTHLKEPDLRKCGERRMQTNLTVHLWNFDIPHYPVCFREIETAKSESNIHLLLFFPHIFLHFMSIHFEC